MSLAEEMRKKTAEALQKLQMQETLAKLQTQQKTEEFRKKTARLAVTRYEHIIKLIEGAASNGKSMLEFPSGWGLHSPSEHAEKHAIFSQVADELRENGFNVDLKIEDKPQTKNYIQFPPDRRIMLYIKWNKLQREKN